MLTWCLREEKNKQKEEELKARKRMEIEAEVSAREREIERQEDTLILTLVRYTSQLKVFTCLNYRTLLSYGSLPISANRSALLKPIPQPAPTFSMVFSSLKIMMIAAETAVVD